jgi:hypothetical protein
MLTLNHTITPTRTAKAGLPQVSRPAPAERLVDWDFPPLVERLVEKHELAEADAQQLFADLKKFLVVCSLRRPQDPQLSPPERIDLAWHEFILFTQVYWAFCQELCGRYIHHTPYTHVERMAMQEAGTAGDGVRRAIEAAKARFGTLSRNWAALPSATGDCEACAPSTACGMNDPSCW